MMKERGIRVGAASCLMLAAVVLPVTAHAAEHDPLPSWKEGAAKAAIVDFVTRTTDPDTEAFVAPAERIATFDNDGTLWSEQPLYFQLAFALDQIPALADEHPEWKNTEPFKSVLAGDLENVMDQGMGAIKQIVGASHAGMTSDEFTSAVRQWLDSARHPTKDRPYAELVFQPMLELLNYLRSNGYRTYIVSGGGIDFMRVFVEEVYGVPPEQVIGSTLSARFEMRDGYPTIVKESDVVLVDDKAGKPVGIYRHIGRRPVFAAGNSDGDLQMLQYTTVPARGEGERAGFALIVHHTDADREWAYDRDSHIGRLDRALSEADKRGWTVVDMKEDWKRIYPEQ